ncbi:MFS transporter [Bradyrhizobium sp.]|uniref:MFS transporter n=1 Tax=Bradyrhizobium sp. TaxID=376 RepID=UPI0023A73F56|nr:MFS transporter [Bradyrhizobium sp.]MDE1933616.1 MFS transporter [Bradyrhizobium sp.]
MKNLSPGIPVHRRFAPTALMLGNIATGCSILAPAGMLIELAADLDITVHTAGLLVTFGAIILCIGSPLTAWLTSRIERRALLAFTLAVLALGNIASAFAPDYAALLAIRLVMLAVGALYTPQAAGTAALIVPAEKRGGTIAYVFLGWSLAAAIGLPLITFLTSHYGWRAAYGSISIIAVASLLSLLWRLPKGLVGTPVDLKTWTELARNPVIVTLLGITTLLTSGQFAVFTYMGPLLSKLTHVGPDAVGLVFGIYGVCGFIGLVIISNIVDSWGPLKASVLSVGLVLAGVAGWALSAGFYSLTAAAVAIWGLGFASSNSMQQVRLVAAAPPLASASVALNTSCLYVGQAIGSAIGGLLYAHERLYGVGYAGAAFVALALVMVVLTRRLETPA